MEQSQVLQNNLEYLSMSKPRRVLYKFTQFFTNIPKKVSRKASALPRKMRNRGHAITNVFKNLKDALVSGDWSTRLSFLVMGVGLMAKHQIIRGIIYCIFEILFVAFMIGIGGPALSQLSYLGGTARADYSGYSSGISLTVYSYHQNSFTIMLYSLIGIIFIVALAVLWYSQIVDSLKLQRMGYIGKYASDKQTLRNTMDKSYDKTLLLFPTAGLVIFTILPIVMMVIIAFTNYDYAHVPPTALFDWVGTYNFQEVFSIGGGSGAFVVQTFGKVLLWTLVWAFFATFSNYFLGMIVAMIINIKGIKLKKLWRTILITTIAVPQFISLLLVSQMFSDGGLINALMQRWGWISTPIHFLTNEWIAKVMIIVINTWIGIPYTMLICTGLLMNIPEDLYESARIDGASPAKMYFKITLPYMLFVTGPYLISQFVGNINNFNVIYLLSNGGPTFVFPANVPVQFSASGVGKTDLLITWIYKLTTNASYDYGIASVLGILVFAVVAFISLLFYNNSSAVKDEEAFQ
jgi:arabinogalactan oligomer/maltooligosaccharide transport system permease protein